MQQYNLMVRVFFSVIRYDPKVSHLFARFAMPIANVMKGLSVWGGGLKNNLVDYREKKFFLTCLILSGKGLCDILKFCSSI